MNDRSAVHDTFVIERTYEAKPARVYEAFANPAAKARWFSGTPGEWTEEIREQDFRLGGRERLRGLWKSGVVSDFQCVYHDIVPEQRIVYTYTMNVGEQKISVSLATVEFRVAGSGTQLKVTEQGVFLDGFDDNGGRRRGTAILLDRIEESLR